MKTIILYASKYGAAAEAARRIAERIDGAVVHDLKQGIAPSLDGFDCVIVGSSVYAGSIRREAKVFLSLNTGILLEKKLGLFLCGMAASNVKPFFDDNFSAKILQKAKAVDFFGGIFDPKKAGAFDRFVIRIVTKKSGYVDTMDDSKIERFAEAMKA
jgi:menaquinone-dependent protoporphyrinogen oxidase